MLYARWRHLGLRAGQQATVTYEGSLEQPRLALIAPGREPRAPDLTLTSSRAVVPVPGPQAQGSFTDCAKVGWPVEVSDPPDDLRTNVGPSNDAALVAHFPGAELRRVRLAANASVLCAEFTAKGPATAAVFYILDVHAPAASPTLPEGPGAAVDVLSTSSGVRQVALKYPSSDERADGGIVRAVVGVTGNRLSLRIPWNELPSFARSLSRFTWTATAVAQTGESSPQQIMDYVVDQRPYQR